MKRLHVLASDMEHAKSLYEALIAAGVEKRHFHVLAKDHAAIKAAGLPEPSPMEEAMISGEGDAVLISNLMGTTPASPKVHEHKQDIEAGKIMFIFAVAKERVDEIVALVRKHQAATA